MASFILKGLVTNDGIDCLQKWHRPFTKMASISKNGIDRLRKGNQQCLPSLVYKWNFGLASHLCVVEMLWLFS